MSDYMFVLESHLTGEQSRVLAEIRSRAEQEGLNLFLTGGAMRDMMGGFPIRDLDVTVEGAAIKFAKTLAHSTKAEIIALDDLRKSAELKFPSGVTASISMARQEYYPKPASKPQVKPATIHEDLRGRDFTVNAIALSLGNASRGLLLDPTNGLGDLSSRELRAIGNHALYDDPSRILRLIRLRVRLKFNVDERTWSQYQNVREAGLASKISTAAWKTELQQIAVDPEAGEILKALEEEQLLKLVSPALSGNKLNLAGFAKLQKARQVLPFGSTTPPPGAAVDWFPLFLITLSEKLTPRERGQLARAFGLEKSVVESSGKLEARAKKAEKEIAGLKVHRPSALYAGLSKIPLEALLLLLVRSNQRIVLDRVKNYLQKYLPVALEVTENDVIGAGAQPGTAKFAKVYQSLIAARLDARPKKVVLPEPPPPPPPPQGRRAGSFARS
jgi:tRNA nucleotidyltransferase/poly(A) polymerase